MADDLDSLIFSLNKRLDEVANPNARGLCGRCKRDIMGRMIQAMKSSFHEECWKCSSCSKLLGTGDFFEHEVSFQHNYENACIE